MQKIESLLLDRILLPPIPFQRAFEANRRKRKDQMYAQ